MKFGYFDDHKREYVITRPDTPLPWINYLGSEAYFGLISNTAGGYSFYRDARLRRLTRYRYNNSPLDNGGATSTYATRLTANFGRQAGSLRVHLSNDITAVTAWAILSSNPSTRAWKPARAISSRRVKISKCGT